MPSGKKQSSGRGIPRKASNPNRKKHYELYRLKTVCRGCTVTFGGGKDIGYLAFSSPAKLRQHVASGHANKSLRHTIIPIGGSSLLRGD